MPQVDRIICAGDLVGYGGRPNEVVELAKSRDVLAVLGDHEHAIITRDFDSLDPLAKEAAPWTSDELTGENLEFLRGLPKSANFSEEGRDIYMVHGSPRNPFEECVYPDISNRILVKLTQKVDANVIVLAHTHIPMERTIQGKLIINPGSVGQPRDRDPNASYMVLKLGRGTEVESKRTSYDVDGASEAMREASLPEELATRLHFGW